MLEILFYDVRQSPASLREEETVQRKEQHGGRLIPLCWKSSYERCFKMSRF